MASIFTSAYILHLIRKYPLELENPSILNKTIPRQYKLTLKPNDAYE